MQRHFLPVVLCCLVAGQSAAAPAGEEAAIVEVVDRAYVHGVHIDQNADEIRSGMHDSFVMFVRSDDGVKQVTRDEWIARIEESKGRARTEPVPETRARIEVLDRSENAAVAKVELFRDGKQIFTDYISLYRFDDGWKMVGKIFQRH